jgi:adenine-specific DNA-methyltransferase
VAKRLKTAKKNVNKHVETLRHTDDKRLNIPTAEHQSVLEAEHVTRKESRYPRNTDLDPQLVWRGKDYQDWSDLVVQASALYIQEKVHPKALIDDLLRESKTTKSQQPDAQIDLFADFNGVAEGADRTDFYQHDQNWTNRMILGDSLQVMASLAEREGLRGKVQCIYIDPPYGIKFNSNFQWSTTTRDVRDGNVGHITREPEQVKAFRDTWRDGVHSYLTYLRDRLTVARDLLTESGSIFVQIGDENVHRVRALLDEVFGDDNLVSFVTVQKAGSTFSQYLGGIADFVLWYAKDFERVKYRALYGNRNVSSEESGRFTIAQTDVGVRIPVNELPRMPDLTELVAPDPLQSASAGRDKGEGAASWFPVSVDGRTFRPTMQSRWKTNEMGMKRLIHADRIIPQSNSIRYARHFKDFSVAVLSNIWNDLAGATDKVYVVQTSTRIVERCVLMATDPGDLVLDPTCGSGTTATVAEQWGRRWMTIDTSRVALALARARVMGARYPYYTLADSPEGLRKEAEITGRTFAERPTHGSVRHGFVYERVPHITLKSIVDNAEIDVIWEEHQPKVQSALDRLNTALRGLKTPFPVSTGGRHGKDIRFDASGDATFTMPSGEVVSASALVEWEVPREPETPWPTETQTLFFRLKQEQTREAKADLGKIAELLRGVNHNLKRSYTLQELPERPADPWPEAARDAHRDFWDARIARQKAIDASIASKAEFESLYDRPYSDPKTVRVAGPFTVESLSPHRTLGVDENDELIDPLQIKESGAQSFEQMILENLHAAGVQQAHKEGRITFEALIPWPGEMVCAEGRYREGDVEKRAAIFIGPEFGTVQRPDLVKAAREAGDAGFDVLIACAFNYEAHATEFSKLGRIPVLKARMNADLHMGGDLKPTGKGNLFVVFGEPDIEILHEADGRLMVHVKGVDVFDPTTGEVRSDGPDGIACWFIDTDYNEESFFVRHAYFLGQNDPYGALKTTLKAEIDADVWATLNSAVSRRFPMPTSGRIAVKVINHLGDEVMKVFRVA